MRKVILGNINLGVVDRGSGQPLVLVHGFPLDHTMWRAQIDELSCHARVLAPDLRGFGSSSVTEGEVTMAQFADDLVAMLDAVEVYEPVVLCGLSMGGYIAWQFWRKHSARLRGLILCDTRAAADTVEIARGRSMMAGRVLREGTGFVADTMIPRLFAEETCARHPEIVELARQTILRTTPAGVAAATRGMAQRPDMTGQLGAIDVPTLVICGQHDAITPPGEMQQIAAALPEARYVEIPGAGHLSPLENPRRVNAAILDFMEAQSATGS